MALTQEFTTQAGALCVGVAAMASPVAAALTPALIPLTAMAAMGLHLKDGCAQKASAKAQKAIFKALKGQPEFPPETLTRAQSLLRDADSPLNLSRETLLAAARSGAFEAEAVKYLLAPLTLDQGESSVRQILETALLAGLGACRKDESFHQALTQELLIEAAHVANVQLELLDEIKTDTSEIKARLDELTLQNGTLAKALDTLESQSKGQLEALASRFEIPRAYDMSTEQLRAELNARAEDYRTYRAEIEAIDERTKGLGNLKAAAADAVERLDFEEVENLLSRVDEVETEIAAQGKEIRARNALMRGRAEQAFTILNAAANSFDGIGHLTPSKKRNAYFPILYNHGLRYGGPALPFAITLLQTALAPLSMETAPKLWASIKNNLAVALRNQANRTEGAGGAALLQEAVTAYHAALTVRTKAEHPVQWAGTQNNLATALDTQANRTEGAGGAALLQETVTAYRAALTVYTKAEHPLEWAMTQNNLAIALFNQASRTEGAGGAVLLQEAVTAYRAALTVYTKAEHPVDWSMTQNNLAAGLATQANRTEGAGGAALLQETVTAYRAALTVRTKAEHPVHWAMTQNNLAAALANQASRTEGAGGAVLLQEAVTAFRAALTVRTKAEHPVQWAETQNNLAAALANQANRTEGAGGAALLQEAVTAYRAALTVRTKAEHPVDWAMTKENLAILELSRAQQSSGQDQRSHLEVALAYVEEALTVYDPVHMAPNQAKATRLRDHILKALSN